MKKFRCARRAQADGKPNVDLVKFAYDSSG
jgi:hypothetical protein